MKKIKYVLLILLVTLSINVRAADNCDSKELKRLKELAKKVEFDYDYKLVNDEAVFSISATNLNEDLRVLIIENYYEDKYREFKGETSASLDGFKSGERVVVTIKGFVANGCSGVTVLTKTVKLPYYNYYYDWNRCSGNENFKYCKYLLDANITKEEFDKQFELFMNKKIEGYNKESETENVSEKRKFDNIYFVIVSIAILLIVLSIIIIRVRKIRNRNKL